MMFNTQISKFIFHLNTQVWQLKHFFIKFLDVIIVTLKVSKKTVRLNYV